MDLRVATAAIILASCGSTKVATIPTTKAPLAAPELEGVEPKPMPWRPFLVAGEYALYDLKVRGLVVGEIEVATGAPGVIDGAVAHYVVMRGTSAGMAKLFVTAEINLTAEISSDADRRRRVEGKWRSMFRGREKTGKPKSNYRKGQHNPISALVGLRGYHPEPGEAISIPIGKRSRTELILIGQNRNVRGPFRRPARRLVGVAKDRSKKAPFEVWISDDADRIPLLVRFSTKYGDVTLELVGYRRKR